MSVSIFEKKLSGGHPNSLGNTEEVVAEILKDTNKLEELYKCYFSQDEVVRLRTSSCWKRVAKYNIQLFLSFLDRFIEQISTINQPSTKWTLAILFEYSSEYMNESQKAKAIEIIMNNLEKEKDWIVRKNSMDTLGFWALNDAKLRTRLIPVLNELKNDPKKVVPKTAKLWLGRFD